MSTTTGQEVDVLQPFGKEADHVIPDEDRGPGYDPELYKPPAPEEDMGAVAAQGLDDDGQEQPTLDGGPAEGAKVTFLGVQYNDITESLKLGQPVEFTVSGRVIDAGEKIMGDGHKRKYFKVDVDTVTPA